MQIVVLGMHRSGTSAITGLLHEMGAYVGASEELLQPMGCNPEGFWERQDVAAVNDALLASFNASWDMPNDVDLGGLSPRAERDFLESARPIVDALNAHKPWVVKDPRLSLLFPKWRTLLDAPVAVICWRQPVEVAHSLKSRDGFPVNYGLALWEWYTVAALHATEGIPRVFVSYNDLMEDALSGATKLYQESLGLGVSGLRELSADQVGAIISPKLHREHAAASAAGEFLNQAQASLLDWLGNPQGEFKRGVSEGACETVGAVGSLRCALEAANQHTAAANAGWQRCKKRVSRCMQWTDGLSDASDVLLRSWSWSIGQYVGKAARILSRVTGPGPDGFIKTTSGAYRNWMRSRDLRVIALISAYNEEALIGACIDHLVGQGLDVFVIDNESTDRTAAIARQYEGRGVIGVETQHRRGVFSVVTLLRRKEELATELDADWFLHVDADEFRLPPPEYASLREAFAAIDAQGFNAAEFMEYTFVATQEHPEHLPADFLETMQWYYPFQPFRPHRINAWKRGDGPVDLQSSGGHQVKFPGRKVCPEYFILKHYTYLSRQAAIEKFVNTIYDPSESDMHGFRHNIREDDIVLPVEQALRRYAGDLQLDGSSPRTGRFIADRWLRRQERT